MIFRPLPVIHLEKDLSTTGFGILCSGGVETAGINDNEDDGLLQSSSLSPSPPTRNHDTIGDNSNSSSDNRNNMMNTNHDNNININNNSTNISSNPASPNSSLKSKLIASVTMKNSSSMLSPKYQKSTQKQQRAEQLLLQNQQSQRKYEIELAPLMDLGLENNNNNHNNFNFLERMEEESNHIRDSHVIPDWKLAFIQSSSSSTSKNNNNDGHRISIGLISASNSSRNSNL